LPEKKRWIDYLGKLLFVTSMYTWVIAEEGNYVGHAQDYPIIPLTAQDIPLKVRVITHKLSSVLIVFIIVQHPTRGIRRCFTSGR